MYRRPPRSTRTDPLCPYTTLFRSGLPAALGDTRDHRGRDLDIEPAAGEVVEEQQRLRRLHDQIVDAHRDQVDADRVVSARGGGEAQLRADAVGRGDQDGVDRTSTRLNSSH